MYLAYYESPIGIIEIIDSGEGIEGLSFIEKEDIIEEKVKLNENLKLCLSELEQYFYNEKKIFTVKLKPRGTEFQNKVWEELLKIPYGEVRSYKDVAISIGNEKASRAVGLANNKNKIAIIIPCHRVIGSSGKLVGYAAGLARKKYLLELEKR